MKKRLVLFLFAFGLGMGAPALATLDHGVMVDTQFSTLMIATEPALLVAQPDVTKSNKLDWNYPDACWSPNSGSTRCMIVTYLEVSPDIVIPSYQANAPPEWNEP